MVKFPRLSINADMSDGLCFACGQKNPFGLKLRFKWDGKTAKAEFAPHKHHQGWPGVIHGGIISCLIDEAVTHAARFKGLHCLTARINISFKRPAMISDFLVITSSVIRQARKLIETKAQVMLQDGTLIAEGTATQFVFETSPDDTASQEDSRSDA